jgi:hypothetical protein
VLSTLTVTAQRWAVTPLGSGRPVNGAISRDGTVVDVLELVGDGVVIAERPEITSADTATIATIAMTAMTPPTTRRRRRPGRVPLSAGADGDSTPRRYGGVERPQRADGHPSTSGRAVGVAGEADVGDGG